MKYLEASFRTFVAKPEFLEMTWENLYYLLGRQTLNVEYEQEVLYALGAWISHNFNERITKIDTLLPVVRFSLLHVSDIIDFSDRFANVYTVMKKLQIFKRLSEQQASQRDHMSHTREYDRASMVRAVCIIKMCVEKSAGVISSVIMPQIEHVRGLQNKHSEINTLGDVIAKHGCTELLLEILASVVDNEEQCLAVADVLRYVSREHFVAIPKVIPALVKYYTKNTKKSSFPLRTINRLKPCDDNEIKLLEVHLDEVIFEFIYGDTSDVYHIMQMLRNLDKPPPAPLVNYVRAPSVQRLPNHHIQALSNFIDELLEKFKPSGPPSIKKRKTVQFCE
jgi:hypothetical protein